MTDSSYGPFERGPHPAGVRTVGFVDSSRDRTFPVEVWYPAASGTDVDGTDSFPTTIGGDRTQQAVRDAGVADGRHPLVLFSHSGGGDRRQSTFLCTHLASHGFVVAAMDHSERVVPELGPQQNETPEQRDARWAELIAARVPDIRFLLDHMLEDPTVDPDRVGIAGHSFGGWTALAAAEVDERIRCVVALAPAGASERKPGILPVELTFDSRREIPKLLLVGDADASLPLSGMEEIHELAPTPKQMVVLRGADHMHFMDDVETLHEVVRTMPVAADWAEIQKDMRPIGELASEKEAHDFVRGLTVSFLESHLRGDTRFAGTEWMNGALAERDLDASIRGPA